MTIYKQSIEENTMPFARVDLVQGKSEAYRTTVGDCIYDAMVEALGAPKDDRFQVITEHPAGEMSIAPDYLGIKRTAECIFIQVTLNSGRSTDTKKAFYKAVVDNLHQRLSLRREDVLINLIEVPKENWSFGLGEAQYA
jgi:4-oxalocrotonate tautomerase